MRARNPIWKRDRISAGRTSERTTARPEEMAYTRWSAPSPGIRRKKGLTRIAIQNAGIDTPINATVITNESTQVRR